MAGTLHFHKILTSRGELLEEMNKKAIIRHISGWLKTYAKENRMEGFVVGISGGIDSAVTSALCAKSGMKVLLLNMPIRQSSKEAKRGKEHIQWLQKKYVNVLSEKVDLGPVFKKLEKVFPGDIQDFLVMANCRARLRMLTLYAFASRYRLLVAGTGNKVEDFGIGFFTKYGDGGVDLSPIADLNKTQVYELAKELGIVSSIQNAKPTDGLFADERTDEDQIGATYPELEWAMAYKPGKTKLTPRQKHVLEIYNGRNRANRHKMKMPPVCVIPKSLFKKK
jgi:NAD+ synthase